MIIDVFTHVLPPRYLEERNRRAGTRLETQYGKYFLANPGLTNLDVRFRAMDKYPDVLHLLTIAGPNLESVLEPKDAVECARIANDEMAELVAAHPDRFAGACACLPMNDVDAALAETDRAIRDLRFRGIEIFTDINGTPLDAPEFMPLYEKMAAYNLPILLHPRRTNTTADFGGEQTSKYLVYTNFGWPYETSVAMARLAFGGPLEQYPDAEDRDAPRRRHDSLLPQARAAVVGLQRNADGLPKRRPDADQVAGRLLPDVLLRHGDSGQHAGADVRLRVLRRRPHGVCDRHAVRQPARRARDAGDARGRRSDADRRSEPKKIYADNARRLFRLPV